MSYSKAAPMTATYRLSPPASSLSSSSSSSLQSSSQLWSSSTASASRTEDAAWSTRRTEVACQSFRPDVPCHNNNQLTELQDHLHILPDPKPLHLANHLFIQPDPKPLHLLTRPINRTHPLSTILLQLALATTLSILLLVLRISTKKCYLQKHFELSRTLRLLSIVYKSRKTSVKTYLFEGSSYSII